MPSSALLSGVLPLSHRRVTARRRRQHVVVASWSSAGATPPGVCAACGENAQTNFVRVVSEDGAVVPWIEDAERAPRPEGQGE